jgi:hypothetical protein
VLVFWEERLVFLSVPKTGSTAVEMALRPRAGIALTDPPVAKHTPYYRYRRLLRPYLDALGAPEFETVAVVREPVDWLGSWWRYRQRDELRGHKNATHDVSFEDFVRGYMMPRETRPSYAAVGSQAKFLHFGHGQVPVDHLFRYEDQDLLLGFLADRLGPLPPLKRLNESPRRKVQLDPGLRDALEREVSREFKVWRLAARAR